MWSGFFWIVLILLLMNCAATLIGRDIGRSIVLIQEWLGVFAAMSFYAIILSLCHYLLATLILRPFQKSL